MLTIKTAKPSDFTGVEREKAAAAAAEEVAHRQNELSMSNQLIVEANENDLFDPESGASLGKAASVPIDPEKKEVVIRVVEDIEDMTFGAGTHYTFKVGQKYRVKENIAKHLDKLGLLYGGGL